MMSDVTTAETKSAVRAWLFYAMAAALLMSAWTGVGREVTGARLGVWLFMVAIIAVNLTPLSTTFRRTAWARLVDDETTRDHRRTSFAAGFWSALAATAAMSIVAASAPVLAQDVSRVTITAGLCAALVSFATLELRAARG